MKRFYLIAGLGLIMVNFSCHQKINKFKNGYRQGRWEVSHLIDSITYTFKGRYKKGKEIRKWKYYENDVLVKREKYKKNICYVTYFYSNGNIYKSGITKTDITDSTLHWYYDGNWKLYDTSGKLIHIVSYSKDNIIDTLE